jgi:hypothetical protein
MTHAPTRNETPTTQIVREGRYVAEVDVTMIETDGGWSPYLSLADAEKIEAVSLALKRGDVATARALGGRVYELRELMG